MKLKDWYTMLQNTPKHHIMNLVETDDTSGINYVIIGNTIMKQFGDCMIDKCDIHSIIDTDEKDYSITTDFKVFKCGAVTISGNVKNVLTDIATAVYTDSQYFSHIDYCKMFNTPITLKLDEDRANILGCKPIRFFSAMFSDGKLVGRYFNFGYSGLYVTIMPKGYFCRANMCRSFYGVDTIPNKNCAPLKLVFSTNKDINESLSDADVVIKYLEFVSNHKLSYTDDKLDKLYLDFDY